MIRTIQNSLQAIQVPAQEMADISLRGSAALIQAGCEAGSRFTTLQSGSCARP